MKDYRATTEDRHGKRGVCIAGVTLQGDQLLGLLNGTLRVPSDIQEKLKGATLYKFEDDDTVSRPAVGDDYDGNPWKHGKGIFIGVIAPSFDFIEEGGQMPPLDLQLETV